jgi:hypothetical protein
MKTALVFLITVTLAVSARSAEKSPQIRTCPTDVPMGLPLFRAAAAACGGGMAGDGWDGSGQRAVRLFWHLGNTTTQLGAAQRTAIINALNAWAGAVQITFQEIPASNRRSSLDFNFFTGDHSGAVPAEAGDSDCPFDGAGGALAHAGFPPGINTTCPTTVSETFAGDVHFDDAEAWEEDAGSAAQFSLTLVACHEIGHALGLVHANSGCTDVMRPSAVETDSFTGLTANDIANIRAGYAAGTGGVLTLNDTGIWVAPLGGPEYGTWDAPLRTVTQAVEGVPTFTSGVVIHIQGQRNGLYYPETMTITRNCVLMAEGGAVTIGRGRPWDINKPQP